MEFGVNPSKVEASLSLNFESEPITEVVSA